MREFPANNGSSVAHFERQTTDTTNVFMVGQPGAVYLTQSLAFRAS